MNRPRILIADDTPASLTLLSHVLEPQGYEILAVSSGKDALKLAERARPDLILLDVMMPGHDGFHVCRTLKAEEATRDIPVIFITSRQETESVLNGFRMGAVDYIVKPFQAEEVVTRVATHLKISGLTRELQQRNAELEAEVARRVEAERTRDKATQRLSSLASREAQRWGLDGFVGGSPHMQRILADIERLRNFAKTSVLITGESGTGKELVARALHHHSPRAEAAFIPVNCVAVPADLLESLFFGHVKGAFTGATADRKGYFELADGGTLFLDEIGDMPAALQAKLLRVLEDGEVTPVGSTKSHHVDVRVLSATNADLSAKILSGEFRQDLYYRLARYTVETAPLRERREDLPLLAGHFLKVFAAEMGMAAPALDETALKLLQHHSFPGNVRELKNAMERALILSGGKTVRREHLQLFDMAANPAASAVKAAPARVSSESVPMNLEAAEHTLIQRALEQTGGNVTEAARLLNVNRSRIYRRMPGVKQA
ncbi:sigma-54 dependent transcriptional regulator [Prosthecobacter sp. SYSU 5D2]|uniref:sigma-54-dependent transcriptional regulator n=1 Tax=Prosthecobacter sp. SYSU 5D2 TaxID=3134134 RepID=UPI0031FEA8E7